MRTVWKYRLPNPGESSTIPMPVGATIVHVALQGASIFMWALVQDEGRDDVGRRFYVLPTGGEASEGAIYLGTVHDGSFVWHAFEVPAP